MYDHEGETYSKNYYRFSPNVKNPTEVELKMGLLRQERNQLGWYSPGKSQAHEDPWPDPWAGGVFRFIIPKGGDCHSHNPLPHFDGSFGGHFCRFAGPFDCPYKDSGNYLGRSAPGIEHEKKRTIQGGPTYPLSALPPSFFE